MATPIWQWSAVDTAAAIRDGRATSEEVVQAHIDRMHAANPAINAIVVGQSGNGAAGIRDLALSVAIILVSARSMLRPPRRRRWQARARIALGSDVKH